MENKEKMQPYTFLQTRRIEMQTAYVSPKMEHKISKSERIALAGSYKLLL